MDKARLQRATVTTGEDSASYIIHADEIFSISSLKNLNKTLRNFLNIIFEKFEQNINNSIMNRFMYRREV